MTRENSQPGEAQRWMKQAKYDLDAAVNDGPTAVLHQSFEWVSFKCYKAAEKALRAAQYAKDWNKDVKRDQRLSSLTSSLEDETLTVLTLKMDEMIDTVNHTQDPSCHSMPDIPHDVFDETKSDEIRKVSEAIYKRCQEYIDEILNSDH